MSDGTHLHGFTVEEVNVGFLLVVALADQQQQGREVFLLVDGLAAEDVLKGVFL